MDSRAKGRLALTIVATVAFAAFLVTSPFACDTTRGCPSDTSNLDGVAANALPTYPEAVEDTATGPVKLTRFTRAQIRTARVTQANKARLAQRARASRYASARKAAPAAGQPKSATKITPVFANANAELVEADVAKAPKAPRASETAVQTPQPAAAPQDSKPAGLELVAAEDFNDLDKAAWEANQMPRLMQLSANDARAELRDDDSRWAQTSMIGKVFVALGAMLTLASAVRMFMA